MQGDKRTERRVCQGTVEHTVDILSINPYFINSIINRMIKMKAISFKRLASALCGFLLCMPMLLAQNTITVKGKVIDQEKQPVIGAAVLQSGTTNGAATDIDGNFTLTVPTGADLEVSAIGYETLLVKATSSQLTITLNEESTTLDETVVVGYGTTKKASLTSAITNIREEELTATKQSDVTASLQGKVPGLLIHQVSGGAGDFDTDLNIRRRAHGRGRRCRPYNPEAWPWIQLRFLLEFKFSYPFPVEPRGHRKHLSP